MSESPFLHLSLHKDQDIKILRALMLEAKEQGYMDRLKQGADCVDPQALIEARAMVKALHQEAVDSIGFGASSITDRFVDKARDERKRKYDS